jgi:hypothetical protein
MISISDGDVVPAKVWHSPLEKPRKATAKMVRVWHPNVFETKAIAEKRL